jgi:hypothetical protein
MMQTANSDLIAQLRAELVAAQAVLEPQLRGLRDYAVPISISPVLLAQINDEIAFRQNRYDLLGAVIAALDALTDDGYPELPDCILPQPLWDELQGQAADLAAATSVFENTPQASQANINLGEPIPKPGE